MRDPKFFRQYDYDRSLLPNAHLRELDDVANLTEAKEKTGWSIGYPGWGLLYYLVMTNLDPEAENIIIETGTNVGSSTIMLAQALIDSKTQGHLHTFEIDQTFHDRATNNLAHAGVSGVVTQYLGDAKKLLPPKLDDLGEIRVAFLDGSHLVVDVLEEFAAVHKKLARNGLVIFDNTYLIADEDEDQRVHGALATLMSQYGGNLINLPSVSWYTPGVAIWQQHPFDERWDGLPPSSSCALTCTP